jgi:hypothetical protein
MLRFSVNLDFLWTDLALNKPPDMELMKITGG